MPAVGERDIPQRGVPAFGDALFLSLAETTIEFASHDPQRAREIIALGFEAMWHALHEADA
ncbi:TetR family transcriptional regulator [Klebsiella pneumoniae]|nr:TetR family transcriptional regulator [Klebsiella pneumoniae]